MASDSFLSPRRSLLQVADRRPAGQWASAPPIVSPRGRCACPAATSTRTISWPNGHNAGTARQESRMDSGICERIADRACDTPERCSNNKGLVTRLRHVTGPRLLDSRQPSPTEVLARRMGRPWA